MCHCECRYIIGEIMYGGHVVEDWDRRLTSAYLQTFFQEGLLEGQLIIPKFDFRAPTSNMNHRQVKLGLVRCKPFVVAVALQAGCGCRAFVSAKQDS